MLLLLFISALKITLITEKDTFYVGEQIKVGWKIVNEGENTSYIEKAGKYYISWNNGEMWDKYGKKIPHTRISYSVLLKEGEKYKIPMKVIASHETLNVKDVKLIGDYGNNEYSKYGGAYLNEGEYWFRIFYQVKEGKKYRKVYSDTFHFWVIFPTGEDRKAFEIYRRSKEAYFTPTSQRKRWKRTKYTFELLKEYPYSVYTRDALSSLNTSLIVHYKYNPGTKKVMETFQRSRPYIQKIVNLLEEKINEFPVERQLLAIKCITYGELNLGKTKEEVKEIVKKLNVKTDKEINTLLEIQEK